MNLFHIILFIIKLIFVLQFAIAISGKYKIDRKIYIMTEIIFKVCLSLYIEGLMFFTNMNIGFEDKLIITFASGLLLYDAVMNDMIDLLELYNIHTLSYFKK